MKKPINRRLVCFALLLVIFLIALDQGAKLAVDQLIGRDEALMQVTNPFHIHPYLNDEDVVAMQPLADESGIPVKTLLLLDALKLTLMSAGFFLLVYAADRFFFWDNERKSYPKLTILLICLFISAMICSVYIDEFCWGGSLDFLCIVKDAEVTQAAGDHVHTYIAPHHKIYDLKDLYLMAHLILLLVRVCLWLGSLLKLCLNEQTRATLEDKFKHPIANIDRMRTAHTNQS